MSLCLCTTVDQTPSVAASMLNNSCLVSQSSDTQSTITTTTSKSDLTAQGGSSIVSNDGGDSLHALNSSLDGETRALNLGAREDSFSTISDHDMNDSNDLNIKVESISTSPLPPSTQHNNVQATTPPSQKTRREIMANGDSEKEQRKALYRTAFYKTEMCRNLEEQGSCRLVLGHPPFIMSR